MDPTCVAHRLESRPYIACKNKVNATKLEGRGFKYRTFAFPNDANSHAFLSFPVSPQNSFIGRKQHIYFNNHRHLCL